MAELPELLVLAEQMGMQLAGRSMADVEVVQPKCLNLPVDQFARNLIGHRVMRVYNLGKWLALELSEGGHLLINLGMGADLLYYEAGQPWDDGHRVRFHLDDGSGFTCRFWWFGHAHYCPTDDLSSHTLTASLGPPALSDEMDRERFGAIVGAGRGRVKALITDQKRISGIGNVYVQDVLFRARLHPMRPARDLSEADVDRLYQATTYTLRHAYEKRGLAYEKDFYGRPGGFTADDFLVGYREGKPCPECGTTVIKIKTGSTSSFICPHCQPE